MSALMRVSSSKTWGASGRMILGLGCGGLGAARGALASLGVFPAAAAGLAGAVDAAGAGTSDTDTDVEAGSAAPAAASAAAAASSAWRSFN